MKLARPVLVTVFAAAVLAAGALAWRAAATDEVALAVSYTLLDGRKGNTASMRGKVILINFWATSCATCVAKMPEIAATHQQFKSRGFETLAVAMRHDAPASVVHFAQTRQLPFGVAIDNPGDIARRLRDIQLPPTTLLIDKRGHIVKRYVGAPDFAALHALIEILLAEA